MAGSGGVIPKHVYLYGDPSSASLDLSSVADHVQMTFGLPAKVRKEFASHHARSRRRDLAAEIASTRIVEFARQQEPIKPPPALIDFEQRILKEPTKRVPGVLYDGFRIQGIYRGMLSPQERSLSVAHVAFTPRLLGTFDDADRRFHARAIVLGFPSLISTSGLVEGPAKPRAFYAAKRGLRIDTADVRYEALKHEYASRFLDYDDPRLTDVARGYVLQALFYLVTGEAFCEDARCVLFNAHWQEELLETQLRGLLCDRHGRVAQAVRAQVRAEPDGRRTRPQ